jgi:hypothetical protein
MGKSNCFEGAPIRCDSSQTETDGEGSFEDDTPRQIEQVKESSCVPWGHLFSFKLFERKRIVL